MHVFFCHSINVGPASGVLSVGVGCGCGDARQISGDIVDGL